MLKPKFIWLNSFSLPPICAFLIIKQVWNECSFSKVHVFCSYTLLFKIFFSMIDHSIHASFTLWVHIVDQKSPALVIYVYGYVVQPTDTIISNILLNQKRNVIFFSILTYYNAENYTFGIWIQSKWKARIDLKHTTHVTHTCPLRVIYLNTNCFYLV